MNEKILNINILNQQFKIQTPIDPQKAKAIIEHLETEISKVKNDAAYGLPNQDREKIVIIAALNIVNEYLDAKDMNKALYDRIDKHLSKLRSLIDKNAL